MPDTPCCDGDGYITRLIETLPDGLQITREEPCPHCNRHTPRRHATDKWFPPQKTSSTDEEKRAA